MPDPAFAMLYVATGFAFGMLFALLLTTRPPRKPKFTTYDPPLDPKQFGG
jgi:hypothetical protein